MAAIYRLFDKRDPEMTRYIGMSNNPDGRLAQHLLCDGRNPSKDAWIREDGIEVGMEVVEEVHLGLRPKVRETYWIHYYLQRGDPLLNISIPVLGEDCGKTERRFDVRVPDANTTLLERLAEESRETGISEARLLVQYATNFIKDEKARRSGALALVASGGAALPATNGHVGGQEQEPGLQPVLNSAVLNSFDDL